MKSIKKGYLLIAEPNMYQDYNFGRSVVFLVEHDKSGSVGFILNKIHEYSSKDLIPEIKYDFPIFKGGPVDTENLYYIHDQPDLIENSLKVNRNLYWGGDFKDVINNINNNKLKLNNIKFFLGYSGWGINQLADEVYISSWILRKSYLKSEILSDSSKNIWKNNLVKLGGNYLIWANSPRNPNHN
tara:strand:+ start:1385 stop:1939 length:555 start_codon:yes stop_codon:yes gene_type:complete